VTLRGYRKFTVAVGVIVISTGLIIFHRLTGAEYVQLVSWVSGLFFGANSLSAVGSKVAEKVEITPKAETNQ
jgi:hypothetical protein